MCCELLEKERGQWRILQRKRGSTESTIWYRFQTSLRVLLLLRRELLASSPTVSKFIQNLNRFHLISISELLRFIFELQYILVPVNFAILFFIFVQFYFFSWNSNAELLFLVHWMAKHSVNEMTVCIKYCSFVVLT